MILEPGTYRRITFCFAISDLNCFSNDMIPDLFDDGVKACWEHIVGEAYGGEIPAGGYEAPLCGTVSKAPEFGGAFHADIMETDYMWDEEDMFSADQDLAPQIAAKEKGPSDTRAPFKYLPGMEEPVGLVGRAYKPFAEFCALMTYFKQDISGFIGWFKDEWGIPDDVDITKGFPVVVGQGDAVWAGVDRVLHPFCSMLKASQPKIRVVGHGKHRTDYGMHTLVDWERFHEIARMIMVQMLADDYAARKHVKRADWTLAGYELPEAPQPSDVVFSFHYERTYENGGFDWVSLVDAFDFAEKVDNLKEQKFIRDDIEIVFPENISQQAILKTIVDRRDVTMVPYDWFENDAEDIIPMSKPVKKIKDLNVFRKGNLYTLIDALLVTRFVNDPSIFPRSAHVLELIKGFDKFGKRAKYLAEGKEIVKAIFGPNFIQVVSRFGDFIEYGRGNLYFRELTHLLGAFHGDYQVRNYTSLFNLLISREAGIKFLLEQVSRTVGKQDRLAVQPTVRELFMGSVITGNAATALASFIKRHKYKWITRYYREAKGRVREKDKGKEMALEQLKASSLRLVKIMVSPEKGVTFDIPTIAQAFIKSASRFIEKRRTHGSRKFINYVMPSEDLYSVARDLDVMVKNNCRKFPILPYIEAVDPVLKGVEAFVQDVSLYFNELVNGIGATFTESGLGDEVDDPGEIEEDMLEAIMEEEVVPVVKKEVVVPVQAKEEQAVKKVEEEDPGDTIEFTDPAPPEEEEFEGFFDLDLDEAEVAANKKVLAGEQVQEEEDFWGFENEKEIVDPNRGKLNTDAELKEDYGELSAQERFELVEEFGEFVTLDEWKNVEAAAKLKKYAKFREVTLASADTDGMDIL
jgi:hypothetical protein